MKRNNLNWSQTIAMYAASLFRLGNFVDAGFVASVLFETYIDRELAQCGLSRPSNGNFIQVAIGELSRHNASKYPPKALNKLRKIRNNSVIHSEMMYENFLAPERLQQLQNDIRTLVLFVWQKFDEERYRRYKQIEAIPHLDADFSVLAVREFFQSSNPEEALHQANRLMPDDFNDMMHMRKHFLHLSLWLSKGLLSKYPNLEVDKISHTDTISGYVWLAVNHKRPQADHCRDRIRHASASIFATPLDLRISIDFGGEAYMGRGDYYSFLASEEAQEFIRSNPGLMYIDLEWYSFVTSSVPAAELKKSEDFLEKLKLAMEQLKKAEQAKQIVTWDRLLLGFVHPRSEISFSVLEEQLEKIIELYYRFERFRCNQLKRKNGLNWVPEEI